MPNMNKDFSLKQNKQNNDIKVLTKPNQVRLVNLDLESPRMMQAMKMLGFEKEDLNTRKRREHFTVDNTDGGSYSPRRETKATVNLKDLKTIS